MTQATKGLTSAPASLTKTSASVVTTSAKERLTQELKVLNLFIYGNLRAANVGVVALRGKNKRVQIILSGVDICATCGTIRPPDCVNDEGVCNECHKSTDTKSKAKPAPARS